MTIDEAIEGLENLKLYPWPGEGIPWVGSIELGIEALKRIRYLKTVALYRADVQLPGETEK